MICGLVFTSLTLNNHTITLIFIFLIVISSSLLFSSPVAIQSERLDYYFYSWNILNVLNSIFYSMQIIALMWDPYSYENLASINVTISLAIIHVFIGMYADCCHFIHFIEDDWFSWFTYFFLIDFGRERQEPLVCWWCLIWYLSNLDVYHQQQTKTCFRDCLLRVVCKKWMLFATIQYFLMIRSSY